MANRDWDKDWETCNDATSGPWEWVELPDGRMLLQTVADKKMLLVANFLSGKITDAHLMCEAREGWPAALERVRELEAQAAVMREALERAGEALLDPVYYETTPDWITNALSADGGRELLQRVRELERELSEALLNVYANERLWLETKRKAEELEEENRKLREVAEKAKALINGCKPIDCKPLRKEPDFDCITQCRWFALKDTIAVLDGWEKGAQKDA